MVRRLLIDQIQSGQQACVNSENMHTNDLTIAIYFTTETTPIVCCIFTTIDFVKPIISSMLNEVTISYHPQHRC